MSDYEEQVEESQETEPEAEDNTQVADAGVPGQILYPDREVDAERAAAFAGGKVDTLYEDDENDAGKSRHGWQNPADRPTEVQDEEESEEEDKE